MVLEKEINTSSDYIDESQEFGGLRTRNSDLRRAFIIARPNPRLHDDEIHFNEPIWAKGYHSAQPTIGITTIYGTITHAVGPGTPNAAVKGLESISENYQTIFNEFEIDVDAIRLLKKLESDVNIDILLNELYTKIDNELRNGNFKYCNSFINLYNLQIDHFPPQLSIGLLTITLMWKVMLPPRESLFARVRSQLIDDYGHAEADKILFGLA